MQFHVIASPSPHVVIASAAKQSHDRRGCCYAMGLLRRLRTPRKDRLKNVIAGPSPHVVIANEVKQSDHCGMDCFVADCRAFGSQLRLTLAKTFLRAGFSQRHDAGAMVFFGVKGWSSRVPG